MFSLKYTQNKEDIFKDLEQISINTKLIGVISITTFFNFVIKKSSIKLFIAESDGDDDWTEVGNFTFLVNLSGFAIEFLEVSERSRSKRYGYALLTKAI